MRLPLLLVAATASLAACSSNDPVTCSVAEDCLQGGIHGTCLDSPESANQWCAFPDSECDSGSRWGVLAGDGLERACVEDVGEVADGGASDADPRFVDAGIDASTCRPLIAFQSFVDNDAFFGGDIYTVNLDGSGRHKITDSIGSALAPAWSPDGRSVAFACALQICVVDALGLEAPHAVNAQLASLNLDPVWSPDGSRIAFVSGGTMTNKSFIMSVGVDGSNERTLTVNGIESSPRWSPDSSKIAFVSKVSTNNEILVMNSDGSQTKNLTLDASDDGISPPAWSPDGSKLLFVSNRTSVLGQDVFVMSSTGEDVKPLSNRAGNDYAPAWSPDGSRIAWRASDGIYVMNADGTGQFQVTPAGDELVGTPVWTDGEHLVFTRNLGVDMGEGELFLAEAVSDASTVRLTNSPGGDSQPTFSACAAP